MIIQLPANGWRPRAYQKPLWNYLEGGGKRAVAIWHRRAGKDDVLLNWLAVAAHERVGNYWYLLPQQTQARKSVWTAVNPAAGKKRIDMGLPPELRKRTLDQEMFIELKNGSTIQLVGSDNYNSLVGSPPVGLIASEWAISDPAAWAYLRPILLENDGWAAFITTPRGRNHAHKMFEMAQRDPSWFAEVRSAVDTGVFTAEQLQHELNEYIAQYGPEHGKALFDQEYMCSFAAANLGSYYGLQMEQAERDGRIGMVPHNPDLPVITAWDLGIGDSTSIWFLQQGAGQVRAIDHYEANGQPLAHYAKVLQNKPYTYSDHIGPHDLSVRELGSGRTRAEIASELGIEFTIAPRLTIEDGINAVRSLLPRMWFDRTKCEQGINALINYRKDWNQKADDWRDKPLHDWSSHACDSLRYFAISTPILSVQEYKTQDKYDLVARRRERRTNRGGSSWMSS